MLDDVQPRRFLIFGNPKADGSLDYLEHHGHGNAHPGDHRGHAQGLHPQHFEAAAVEQAAVHREQAGQQGARRAAQAVHADGAHRVVDFQHLIDELDAENHHESGDQADEERAHRRDCVASGR